MSGTPKFKIFRNGEYVAACRYAEDAAAAVAAFGDVVKYEGRIIWRTISEQSEFTESYDAAADLMLGRIRGRAVNALLDGFGERVGAA